MNTHNDRKQTKAPRRQVPTAGLMVMALAEPSMTQGRPIAKVWKGPNCGCCKDWTSHLQEARFDVQFRGIGNLAVRTRLSISQKYDSCHTAQISGDAIEGYVPASDIQRLLRRVPRPIGLAMPGMPVRSPGMDNPIYGARNETYEVLLIGTDSNSTVYQSLR